MFINAVLAVLGSQPTRCLLDTGAAVSILPKNRLLAYKLSEFGSQSTRLQSASGTPIMVEGEILTDVSFECNGQRQTFPHSFLVADIVTDPIVGADFLDRYGMNVDFGTQSLRVNGSSFNFCNPRISLQPQVKVCTVVLDHDVSFNENQHEVIVRAKFRSPWQAAGHDALFCPRPELIRDFVLPAFALVNTSTPYIPVRLLCVGSHTTLQKGRVLGYVEILTSDQLVATQSLIPDVSHAQSLFQSVDLSETSLDSQQQQQIRELISSYSDVFSTGEGDLGRTDIVQHRIPTGDKPPIVRRNYRQPYHLREEAERQVELLCRQGVVEQSASPWSSPVLMVPKKDGTFRFCVDFRGLNAITQVSEFPIPRVEDCIESLSGSVFFSTLDLASGYWQVEMDPADREKTAFSTAQGHFQFATMPMGLSGAPATFQKLMNLVLRGLHWTSALVYLDDIIVFSRTFSEHLSRLEEVFSRLRGAGLKLKMSKCSFAQRSVKFLGHVVSEKGVHTDPGKTEKVSQWPIPTSVKELRSFLGLANYYRRFVENFSSISAPLTELTRKGKRFQWGQPEQDAFNQLRQALCSSPILAYPDYEGKPFRLKTDASDLALGAVLSQEQYGVERVIAYASRKLNSAEQNYSVTEREALAIVWGMSHFRPYLYGRPFLVLTDHRPITFLRSMKDPKGKFARWVQDISSYQFEVAYKPGREHADVDALSRLPETSDSVVAAVTMLQEKDDWKLAQKNDPTLSLVLTQLSSGKHPPSSGCWRAGKLASFRRVWHQLRTQDGVLMRIGGNGVSQFVVPDSLKKDVMRHVHDEALAGHMGVGKTFQRLRESFYWPGYSTSVDEYVRSCSICQQCVGPVPGLHAPLQPIAVEQPFHMIAMDFLEMPPSKKGNKYCLVISDYFTKWPEVLALPDQQALTVARALMNQVVCRHGVPTVIHSDQGRSFDNEVMKSLCRMLGIKKVRTSPYHPESDGLIERLNRTLLQLLSKCVGDCPHDWDDWLNHITFAYRSAVHSSTGFSPFELIYGRKPVLPLHLEFSLPRLGRYRDARAYLEEVQSRQRLAQELVSENVACSQNRQASNAPRNPRHSYSTGDLVLLHDPAARHGKGYKLARSWTGPFRIDKPVGVVNYRIQSVDGSARAKIVHYNRIKPYFLRSSSQVRSSCTSCSEPGSSSTSPCAHKDISRTPCVVSGDLAGGGSSVCSSDNLDSDCEFADTESSSDDCF